MISIEHCRALALEYIQDWQNTKSRLRIAVFTPAISGKDLERMRKVLSQLENNGQHSIWVSMDMCPDAAKLDHPNILNAFLADLYERAIYHAHLVVGINYTNNTTVPFNLGVAAAKRKPTLLIGEPLEGVAESVLINGFCASTSDVQRFIDQYNERANIIQPEMRVKAVLALFRS